MAGMRVVLAGFVADESGATAIEYGLVAAGIAVACIVAIPAVRGTLATLTGGHMRHIVFGWR